MGSNGEIFTKIVLEIFKVSGLFNTEGDRMSEEFGLSSARWKIMGAIEKSDVRITVPEIGRAMGQSRQASQRIVDVMAKDGLIKFIDNPSHKRAKHVTLTGEGKRIYDLLDTKQALWAAEAATELTREELDITFNTIQKMAKYFDK
ncbi:MarR family transcriptional regulator [Agarivorans sp. B2Z047]|uniref:MarR family winged helix-turn-helix transcriptional regulator n=1 Tax=Agarivorans sp. B2Z047 TaxID=2652721 RepID=UPI00128CA40F|nr:MarR family transcriptional regulator [Agarivorans sp. B2Z047]MPW28264.1 MarR family transcriptional regulator [Agarivorans sp. B2Z047]UQN43908.1 MarR family transcriptional regulator [Agarivorans sp. B2Z047]